MTIQPDTTTFDDLIARAEQLVPTLRKRAAETERQRMLSSETMKDLFDAELLRLYQPRRFGGYEADWGAQTRIGRIISRGCASTSWIVSVIGSHAAYVGRMSPKAQEDVWGDSQDVLIATGSVPGGVTIRRVDGGFVLSGQWRFLSGVDHASWALTRGFPEGEGDGPQYYFLYPRADFTIEDDWYVSGMRGTGSKSIRLAGIFVPEHRTLSLPELMSPNPPGSTVNRGYVYRYNFRAFAGTALLGPILGTAETVIDEFKSLLINGYNVLNELDTTDTAVQLLFAESSAEVHTAALLLESLIERQHAYATANQEFPMGERVALVRDRTYAARLCVNAVERLVTNLNCSEVFEDGVLQRYYRDMNAMVQQIGINWDRNMSNCAKREFGMATEIPFFNKS